MVNKYIGNGVKLFVSTSTTVATSTAAGAVQVGGIMSVGGPDGSGTDVDTTCLDSTSNYQTFQKGFSDAGEQTYDVAFDPADSGWAKIKAMDAATTIGNFFTVFPSTVAEHVMKGYVKSVGRTIQRDTMITRSITVKASSGPGYN
jgi:hypothetical protein